MNGTGRDPGAAHRQSIRSFLTALDEAGQLLRIPAAALEYEIGAYLWETGAGPAVLFDEVAGLGMPVFGNVLNSRARMAWALGVDPGKLHTLLASAPDAPREPTVAAQGPCCEQVMAVPDLRRLPVPTFYPGETGPYITAGVIVAKGASGRRNVSFARMKILDSTTGLVGVAPNHHLALLAQEARQAGRPLEVAITVGNHPAVLLAAAYYLELGEDEFDVAGALLGEPLELARCDTVDLEVPAYAEVVIEGVLRADPRLDEGDVSEYSGLYQSYGAGHLFQLRRIATRRAPLFQTIMPGYAPEHVLIGAVCIAAVLERGLRGAVACVEDVAVTTGSCGRLHAVIALRDPADDEVERAIRFALSAVSLIKRVTAVNDDVDIHDPRSVEWAVATRSKPDRDVILVDQQRSSRSDPLAVEGSVTKEGVNATRRGADRPDWRSAVPPEHVLRRVRVALARTDPGTGGAGQGGAMSRPWRSWPRSLERGDISGSRGD